MPAKPTRSPFILLPLLTLAGMVVSPGLMTAQESGRSVPEQIRTRMELYRSGGRIVVGETELAAPELVANLYQLQRFEPIWTNNALRQDLLSAIRSAPDQGLLTSDYHLEQIEAMGLANGLPTNSTQATNADLLLTDALIRLAFHTRFGKVDPRSLDANWNFQRQLLDQDPAVALHETLSSGFLARDLAALQPQRPYYERLKEGLALYRDIAGRGGWDPVDSGPTLKLGMEGPRVLQLRARLLASGDLARDPAQGAVGPEADKFDDEMEAAVRAYQRRNGLETDGAAGRGTLGMMNVPVEDRIDQIRVNLERGRWVLNDLGGDYVVANIAAFEVRIVRDDSVVWTTRAQVGTAYRKTPVFQADMSYTVFNPTWTLPPTILTKDVLPAIRANPEYLAEKHMEVLDHNGTVIDPSTVDWTRYGDGGFPYIIRQAPGPWNALGQAKFIFPNPHFVFMHDTPSQGLFAQDVRAFSSGCIRVEDPVEFAVQVLNEPGKWDRAAVERAIESRKTETVYLKNPIPVLVLYWTAEVHEDGGVYFVRDIYERDAAVLEALNGGASIWMDLYRNRSG